MIREDPSNPLFLRNYAQFLQSKGEFSGAEDCYFCATLADPKDGEILLQYAKLVWELHNDKDKAMKYLEKAARAAPEDSYSQEVFVVSSGKLMKKKKAAHQMTRDKFPYYTTVLLFKMLNCLWSKLIIFIFVTCQVEEFSGQTDHCHSEFVEDKRPASSPLHLATGLGIDRPRFGGTMGYADCMTVDSGDSINVEEYYRRMIEENPSNPLFLRNYSQYLYLQAAEEYYSRAMHLDPSDGELTLQYAKLIWELRNDRHEALPYFKQAVQAAPGNSNVLAAYARFLWETEEDEGEDCMGWEDKDHVPVPQGTSTIANA